MALQFGMALAAAPPRQQSRRAAKAEQKRRVARQQLTSGPKMNKQRRNRIMLAAAICCLPAVLTGCGQGVGTSKHTIAQGLKTSDDGLEEMPFVRGDANGDGILNGSDTATFFVWQYAHGAVACEDAVDANDDGLLTVGDGINMANHVAESDFTFAAPTGEVGSDPTDDDLGCDYHVPGVDPAATSHRLVVNDGDLLAATGVSFASVLQQIVDTSNEPDTTIASLYQQWWDDVGGVNCVSSIAGKANDCSRSDHLLSTLDPFTDDQNNPHGYLPVALFNRFDMADAQYQSCGQYRIVFALRSGRQAFDVTQRNFIIFEAEVPNPGEGLAGCAPLLNAWNALGDAAQPWDKATIIAQMLFGGLEDGFPAVVQAAHYSGANGQVRSSTFWRRDSGEQLRTWAFREYKLTSDCIGGSCGLKMRQVPLGRSPHLSRLAQETGSKAMRAAMLGSVSDAALAATTFSAINPGQLGLAKFSAPIGISSHDHSSDRYERVLSDPSTAKFISDLDKAAQPYGLSARNILDRANSQTCVGCHSYPDAERFLGNGVEAALPAQFTHIDEWGSLSPGLRLEFLPARLAHWSSTVGFDPITTP